MEEAKVGEAALTMDVHAPPLKQRRLAGRALHKRLLTSLDGPAEEIGMVAWDVGDLRCVPAGLVVTWWYCLVLA